jgi:hypothetical protein
MHACVVYVCVLRVVDYLRNSQFCVECVIVKVDEGLDSTTKDFVHVNSQNWFSGGGGGGSV